jgi:hypothetical protein
MISMPDSMDPKLPPVPVPTLQQPTPTPGQIAEQRAYAKLLMDQKYTPPNTKYPAYTWANGLDTVTAKVMSGLASRDADRKERQLYGGAASSATSGLPGAAPPATPAPAAGFNIFDPKSWLKNTNEG